MDLSMIIVTHSSDRDDVGLFKQACDDWIVGKDRVGRSCGSVSLEKVREFFIDLGFEDHDEDDGRRVLDKERENRILRPKPVLARQRVGILNSGLRGGFHRNIDLATSEHFVTGRY